MKYNCLQIIIISEEYLIAYKYSSLIIMICRQLYAIKYS